jgi:nitrogen regulatory protein P-II 1
MKRVEAIIPPAKLDELKEALAEVGVPGMTVREERVFGGAARRHEVYRGSLYIVDFVLKIRIEIVVRDDKVSTIVQVLERSTGIGKRLEHEVFVSDVVEVVRIRTGDCGEEAIDLSAYALHAADALDRGPRRARHLTKC